MARRQAVVRNSKMVQNEEDNSFEDLMQNDVFGSSERFSRAEQEI